VQQKTCHKTTHTHTHIHISRLLSYPLCVTVARRSCCVYIHVHEAVQVAMFILRLMFRGNHFGLLPGEFQISWNMVGGRRWERVHGRFRQMFSKKRMLEGAGPRQKPRSNVAFQAHEKKDVVQNAPYITNACCLGRNVPKGKKRQTSRNTMNKPEKARVFHINNQTKPNIHTHLSLHSVNPDFAIQLPLTWRASIPNQQFVHPEKLSPK